MRRIYPPERWKVSNPLESSSLFPSNKTNPNSKTGTKIPLNALSQYTEKINFFVVKRKETFHQTYSVPVESGLCWKLWSCQFLSIGNANETHPSTKDTSKTR